MDELPSAFGHLDGYARVLGEIGDERAFEPLQDLLEAEESHGIPGLAMEVARALRKIDNARAVDLLHRLLDEPGGDRLAMTLAGMDLMGAAQSLATGHGGELGGLWRGLGAILACREQLRSQVGVRATYAGEIGRVSTEMMRQLEEVLREIGRGSSET